MNDRKPSLQSDISDVVDHLQTVPASELIDPKSNHLIYLREMADFERDQTEYVEMLRRNYAINEMNRRGWFDEFDYEHDIASQLKSPDITDK